ncbi:MoaF C-terminal domain-containing protein [Rouxiella sp. Mn2063]|uniref:MoaF C-terminal domain-containing protein n=1 Tax=Rouxiella sp. Mn2063 TaxID=3395262 RepID=UPI003BC395E6
MSLPNVLSALAEPGWKNYDDFAQGIDTNRLPSTHHWQGKGFTIVFEEGQTLRLAFLSGDLHQVRWESGNEQGVDFYDEVCTSESHYFFSVQFAAKPDECLVLVVNTQTRRVLAVRCKLLSAEQATGGSRLAQRFMAGYIEGETPQGMVPALTRELIGYRALNIYSPNHYYEHFYVNSERYAWQNLRGEQFGHGDMDYATYYKFSPDKYLFSFREKIIPVCSVFFFDYQLGRCTGIFMGVAASGEIQIRPAGAFISKMSFNCYPVGVAPL